MLAQVFGFPKRIKKYNNNLRIRYTFFVRHNMDDENQVLQQA